TLSVRISAFRRLDGASLRPMAPDAVVTGSPETDGFWPVCGTWDGERWGRVPVHTRYTPSISRSWSLSNLQALVHPTWSGCFWLAHADRLTGGLTACDDCPTSWKRHWTTSR